MLACPVLRRCVISPACGDADHDVGMSHSQEVRDPVPQPACGDADDDVGMPRSQSVRDLVL